MMNAKLTELEQILLDAIVDRGGLTEKQIIDGMSECFGHHVRGSICEVGEIHLMIANLENNSLIFRLDADPVIYVSLKPCPNPSCEEGERPYIGPVLWSVKQVVCDHCGLKGPSGYEPNAVESWNAMPRQSDIDALRKQLSHVQED